LREGSRPVLLGFREVPFDDVGIGEADLRAEVDGAAAAAAERADYEDGGEFVGDGGGGGEFGFDVRDEEVLVCVALDAGEGGGVRVLELVGPCLDGECCTCVACMVAEGGDAAAGVVLEEFEVEESAAALGEAGEDFFPTALGFVAVGKLYVGVFEGELVFWQLFEPDYDM
jgi:hypothetical protein